jgi:hypothetical protein
MIYLIIAGIAIASFAGYTVYERDQAATAAVAKLQAQEAAADKQLTDAAAAAKIEAANHITDMEAAYESGEEQAKTVVRTVVAKGANDVASYPVFSNPVCVLPDDSLHNLIAARAGVLPPADTRQPVATVPAAGAAGGRQAGNPVPANAGGQRPVAGVHPKPRPTN